MALVRPRLTDYYEVFKSQAEIDFAIPLLDEDIPLYVDPFLLWRSPSQQDQALHTALISSFNNLNFLIKRGRTQEAINNLILASECDDVGLGLSASRTGKRFGKATAQGILDLFSIIPEYGKFGFSHFEEIQLFIDGISKDRISDITCSFLKSFLIDYTIDQCQIVGLPVSRTLIKHVYDLRTQKFVSDENVNLPVHPETKSPILLVPKRWLRFIPWLNFDDYFTTAIAPNIEDNSPRDRLSVLNYNRHNYGLVSEYVTIKERTAQNCRADPLFKQIPVVSARRKFKEIQAIPSGSANRSDQKYEDAMSRLLSSLFYPHLDFADVQVRSESGSTIKDLVFYNNRSVDFLDEILQDYKSRQLIFELKNVESIDREHINQINRYMTGEMGKFGCLVTRNRLNKAMLKNTIDLWSGQRRCIIALNDEDIGLMVKVFESKQRLPIEVLKRSYLDFRRACPV